MRWFNLLWRDERGAIISAEIMLVATLLVIGVIVGLKSVRDSVVSELADVAQAVSSASQGFWHRGNRDNGGSYKDGDNWNCVDTCASAFGEG